MIVMEEIVELAIGESPSTRYVVEHKLDDGRVVLRPQTELEAMRERMGPSGSNGAGTYAKPVDQARGSRWRRTAASSLGP